MTRVWYAPGDREVDLGCLSGADHAAILALRGGVGRGDRVLLCLGQPDHDELFVREVGGRYFASHFAGGVHRAHEIVRESDERERQRDYWHRAGQDSGFRSESSVLTAAKVVLDVAIHGRTRTGVEVERSRFTPEEAQGRTVRSHRAGWTSLWFSAARTRPAWFHRVPSVGCNHLPWDELPPRGTAVATGLSRVVAAKCTVHDFPRCPAGSRRPCGQEHPLRRPWHGLKLDHVAALVPSGRAVPLLTATGHVHLVPPDELQLYESLTGGPAGYLAEGPSNSSVPCERCGNGLEWTRPGRVLCERCYPIMRLPTSPYPI